MREDYYICAIINATSFTNNVYLVALIATCLLTLLVIGIRCKLLRKRRQKGWTNLSKRDNLEELPS